MLLGRSVVFRSISYMNHMGSRLVVVAVAVVVDRL